MNEKLVLENTLLIHKVIKDMRLYYRNEEEYQNFYDWGLMGLINGVRTYDETKTKASTYLYKCIHNSIARELYLNTMEKRNNKYGKDISTNEILLEDVWGNVFTLLDMIKDESVNIEEEIVKLERKEQLYKAIDKLKPQDQEYIKKYYGLCGYQETTLGELAKEYNISSQLMSARLVHVRKRLKKHLEKI
jgi:RNA polymerase sigma factor (sigma-70 family)